MDSNAPFLIISGLIAIALMVLIGYNLVRLDNRERERRTPIAPPAAAAGSPPTPPHDPEKINHLLNQIIALTGAERGYIALKDENDELNLEVASGLPPDEIQKIKSQLNLDTSVTNQAVNTGEAIITNNAHSDVELSAGEAIVMRTLRSILAVPLKVDGEVIGIAYVDQRMKTGVFNQSDLSKLVEAIDDAAAALIPPLLDDALVLRPQPKKEAKEAAEEPAEYYRGGGFTRVTDEQTLPSSGSNAPAIPPPTPEDLKKSDPQPTAPPPPPPKPVVPPGGQQQQTQQQQGAPPSEQRQWQRSEPPVFGTSTQEESAVIDKDESVPLADREEAKPAVEPEPAQAGIQFSSYYPKEIKPQDWQPLIAYLFRDSAANLVAADAVQQLGEKIASFRTMSAVSSAPLPEGVTVTATPTLPGFQFNPPSVSVGFFEDWHRFDFKLRAHTAPLNAAANGQITFTVEGLIVADIPLSVFVSETAAAAAPPVTTTRKPYDAVFISYSRKDKQIIERVERAYKALGMDILRDMISLRSGEDWNEALLALIDRADIFQLFWSSTSSTSDHVRAEWEYALKLVDEKKKPENFVRPVYWESPLPKVPDPLRHIHFAPQPDLAN